MSLSRLKGLSIPSVQHVRLVTSVAANEQQVDVDLTWKNAKPFKQIPHLGFFEMNKMMTKMRESGKPRYHELFGHFFKDRNTPILKTWIPFLGYQIFIHEPEDVQTLFANDGKNPVEPGFDFFVNYRNYKKDLFTGDKGLLGSHGEDWYKVRSMVQQDMMRPKSALHYMDDLSQVTNEFLDLVEKNLSDKRDIPDVVPLVYRWALEAVGDIFLDSRIGCLNDPPAKEAQEMVDCVENCLGDPMMGLVTLPPFWKIFKNKDFKDFDASAEKMFGITSKLIRNAQKRNEGKVYENEDEMSILAKLTKKCGTESTIPQTMAMDALFAGIDTTGNTSAFMLYLLGKNPEKQELIYNEIKTKLPSGKKLTPAILNDIKYPRAVLQETLRMLPVVGGIGRLTQKDIVLSGYQVPTGMKVSNTFVNTMRSEQHFEKADQFIPERWMRGCPMGNKKAHPFAYIPFSHGPRMCIGRRFAELEVKVLVIETLRRYKLVYDGPKVDLITPFINRPDGPIQVKFEKRID